MKQNTNQIFKAEDLDWKELETAGIHKEKLESNGNMELLLQGEATEVMLLKMEIYGLSPEAEEATGE